MHRPHSATITNSLPPLVRLRALCAISFAFILFIPSLLAETVTATFASATTVPVTAADYTAAGNTVDLALGFTPPTGTTLTIIRNTGIAFISGQFTNLAQGQKVALAFGGITYDFVANYYGGSGNDLVLVWANNRAFSWGDNYNGQLGDNSTTERQLPVPVTALGVLAGKTVVAIAAGTAHSLALCLDGTVAAWGSNTYGRLGDNTTTQRNVPVAVNTSSGVSALSGKTVVAVAAGQYHSLALCSDGTVAAWGYNSYGQLGDNTTTQRNVPVAVNTASGVSALFGKTVVAISAAGRHSLALCSDGTVAVWGYNYNGQLGDNTTTQRNVPVVVNTASGVSALFGKTVVAISAGSFHSLALCSDGTVAAWGYNTYGQLGDNTTTQRLVPVTVNTTSGVSALFGKTVVAIVAGNSHSLALCSDGTVAVWGYNYYGQLGDNTATQRNVPVAVNTASGVSALFDKTVTAIAAGTNHSLALCSDGTVAAWGYNYNGQLGDNTWTQRNVPVVVNTSADSALFGKTVVAIAAGYSHSLALAAEPYASGIQITGNGVSIPDGATTPGVGNLTDFGATTVSSGTVVRTFTIQNTGNLPLNLTGTPKVVVSGTHAADFTVTRQPDSPVAAGGSTTFEITFNPGAAWLRTATLTIANDAPYQNPYDFAVQGTGADTLVASYATASDVPLSVNGFIATGSTVNFTLNHAPATGTDLMVVRNTGIGFINGTFENLAQGQEVALLFGGITYDFVANYYGGSGNDLVLVWANNRAFSWGGNPSGQLGDNSTTQRQLPVPVTSSGELAGKTVVAISGGSHSLALCSDGSVAAWGYNTSGQLGNNTTTHSNVPVVVNTALGVSSLFEKKVVAIAAGSNHSLALCSDGTVAAWGGNTNGQLGINTTTQSNVPVAVNTASGVSALSGKTVVAIAAGSNHSLALCADGTVTAWGNNTSGQLGDNTMTQRNVPVVVNTTSGVSALYGKTVVAIAAGFYHSLALCSDGTVAAWGGNTNGQLGDNTTAQRKVPVAVNTASGVSALFGKTVVAIAAGYSPDPYTHLRGFLG